MLSFRVSVGVASGPFCFSLVCLAFVFQSCSGCAGCHAFQFSMSVSVCCFKFFNWLFYSNLGFPVSPQLALLLLLCCPKFANLCLQLLSIVFAKLLTVFSPRPLGHGRPLAPLSVPGARTSLGSTRSRERLVSAPAAEFPKVQRYFHAGLQRGAAVESRERASSEGGNFEWRPVAKVSP